jgi:hypothetical protein
MRERVQISDPARSQALRILIKALVVIALCSAVINWTLAPRSVCETDLMSYVPAQRLFEQGGNPYSATSIHLERQVICPAKQIFLQVWNPPVLFVTLGWLLLLPLEFVPALFAVLSVSSFVVIWIFANERNIANADSFYWSFLLSLGVAGPLFIEIEHGQWSSLIVATFALALFFYQRRKDRLAGVLLAFSTLKPHLVFLPLLYLMIGAIACRRFGIVFGAIGTTAFLLLTAELSHPGISALWIGREEWPASYLGSTAASLTRAVWVVNFGVDPAWPAWVFPLLGVALVILRRFAISDWKVRDNEIMGWFLVNGLLSPYGFTIDQVALALPIAYYLSEGLELINSNLFSKKVALGVYLLFLGCWPVFFAAERVTIWTLPLQWFVYPIYSMAIVALYVALRGGRQVKSEVEVISTR